VERWRVVEGCFGLLQKKTPSIGVRVNLLHTDPIIPFFYIEFFTPKNSPPPPNPPPPTNPPAMKITFGEIII
jgi:hypothetical protein